MGNSGASRASEELARLQALLPNSSQDIRLGSKSFDGEVRGRVRGSATGGDGQDAGLGSLMDEIRARIVSTEAEENQTSFAPRTQNSSSNP